MEFHPIADLFPLMEAADLEDLAADIREHGLREAIWLHPDGSILDGRNRFRACEIAGVEPRFQTWDAKGSLAAFVVSLNLKRRHLTTSQRAMVAAKLADMPAHRPKKGANLHSSSDAATALNVSERSVKTARKVRNHGDPALVSAVESGQTSVHAAEQEIRHRELPTAAQARKQAKETGHSVLDRTGRYRDGRTLEEERADSDETGFIYQPIRGMREIGSMEASPEEYWRRLPLYMQRAAIEFRDRAHAWLAGFAAVTENYDEQDNMVPRDRRGDQPASAPDDAASA